MTTISASIVADSVSEDGVRLTTVQMRYPRFIHAELMTHRAFSRNARSSRAVPVETLLREIETDPVVPLFWGANQKGMQAGAENEAPVTIKSPTSSLGGRVPRYTTREVSRDRAWLEARDEAVRFARAFKDADYHKQVVNRILEPYMHIDVLVSATQWANFFSLRDHHMAEPHIAVLARAVKARMEESQPKLLTQGQWHLPYVTNEEVESVDYSDDPFGWQVKVSVARCARISYKPFDGNGSIDAEIKRHDDLVVSVPMHASPAEHQATPDQRRANGVGGYAGWWVPEEHGNFHGWKQYRKMLPDESVAG